MQYQKLANVPDLAYAKPGDAGLDLTNGDGVSHHIPVGGSSIIGTGIAVAIPAGHFGLVTMRSGHGFKRDLVSHPGIIDSGYRGEIKTKVFNLGIHDAYIEPGERFCQLTIIPIAQSVPAQVTSLEESERGTGGFGSSGS